LFVVTITLSSNLQSRLNLSEDNNILPDLRFLCKSAVIPSMQISTNNIAPQNIGMIERRPVTMEQYDLLPLQFMMDSDFRTYKFFNRWIQTIVNHNDENPVGNGVYYATYKDNIVSTVTIEVFSENEKSYEVQLHNAFPINLGEIGLSWENSAEVMTLPIAFTYDRIKYSGIINGTTLDSTADSGINIFTSLTDLARLIGLVSPSTGANVQSIINDFTTLSNLF
jgi:hypothetical protein